jgi:BirA family biotin operon repressor/biotin-[acetyl-CoA-carboxylase] ligase
MAVRIVSVLMDWDVRRFETIDSTNTWVMGQARAGAREGLVAVADHQTAGRGRLGRTWEAPPAGANLLCTVLLRPAEVSHLVVACVALAGRDAAFSVAGVSAGLKWPNDLLVGDAKLAGVLAEREGSAVAVGIGMNVAWAPAGAARLGASVSRDDVLAAFLSSLSGWYARPAADVQAPHGAASTTLGREVRVDYVDGTSLTGVAVDVTVDGHLVVASGDDQVTIDAADVIHLR